jgi:glucose/arabinose dehydrogenase
MGWRASAIVVAAALALGALPACGSAQQPAGGKPAAHPGNRKGAPHPSGVGLKKIGEFDKPVYVAGAPGFPDLLFVIEQPGRVEVLRKGHELGHPFLDLRSLVGYDGGERGLLSIAFPPDYAQSRSFYVYYTDKQGNIRIDEFKRAGATRAARGSRRAVIQIPHPVNANHNGGQLQFLGNDLYFGTGDGGSGGDPPNNAQNKDVLLGKLLRIDPRPSGGRPYSIPADNPFVGRPGRDEIYSYGLRNPFRFSFDTVTAQQPRIAIGDVGQNRFEEVDYTTVAAAGGANFGWDAFEGFAPYTEENSGTPDPGGTTKPIFAYSHSRGGGSCAIIGGYVVGDRSLPSLYGRYLYADLCEGQLRSLVPHLGRASGDGKLGLAVSSPTSFGEDDRHHVYVASQEGPVYRLVAR